MPYELWHGQKPDVSHLRVWGCTAYVHVQKDKQALVLSHMEKCIFIDYPDGYNGWKFYNLTSKCTVISECADFDERHLLLSKRPASALQPSPSLPTVESRVIPDSGDDDDADTDSWGWHLPGPLSNYLS